MLNPAHKALKSQIKLNERYSVQLVSHMNMAKNMKENKMRGEKL